jgi:hypothetical protein
MTWLCESKRIVILFAITIIAQSCTDVSHNLNKVGKDKFEALEIDTLPSDLILNDTTYVPIYSDIYSETKDSRFNLTATLSLRNTSFKHSIYISNVDYYNSEGEKTKSFLNKPLLIKPMQSVEYVIEENDTSGGTGANFIIIWGSKSDKVEPLFEGIMISTQGQQGISFSTKGYSISHK